VCDSLFFEFPICVLTFRWASLTAITEIYAKIGEPYLALLPESMPYLFEILEDPNDEVEQVSLLAFFLSCRCWCWWCRFLLLLLLLLYDFKCWRFRLSINWNLSWPAYLARKNSANYYSKEYEMGLLRNESSTSIEFYDLFLLRWIRFKIGSSC
jgi:hypothetical protein